MDQKDLAAIYDSVLPMFSSKSFTVSSLTLRSLINLEFIFLYGVQEYSNFMLLHVAVQFPQHHLLKRLVFLHFIFLPLCHRLGDDRCMGLSPGFLSYSTNLLDWPKSSFGSFHKMVWKKLTELFGQPNIFLFLCQYHTILMTVVL